MRIVIGIPAYNEEKNIGSIILNLKKKFNDILVCDDGSTDLTSEISEKMGACVIRHEKNRGYGGAIKSIFEKASDMDFDILVTFDADGQHRVEDINLLIKEILNEKSDLVIGSRFLNNKQEMPKYRKIGINTITKITNTLGGTNISDSQSGFRAYNKKIIKEIRLNDNGMGISTEILIKSQKLGFKISEVPIVVKYEGKTSSQNPIHHGSSVIFTTLQYIAIERPLTFYGIPGMVFFIIGLIFSIWAIQIYTEQGQLITNIALVGGGSIILGIILLISASILHSIVLLIKEKK